MSRRIRGARIAPHVLLAFLVLAATFVPSVRGQTGTPSARLIRTTTVRFPLEADSNSPAVWERVNGVLRLFVLTSVAGQATRHVGSQVSDLSGSRPIVFVNHPGSGVWFESIIPDVDGTWYGFYHHEWPAEMCAELVRMIPRIGAARSHDFGATWEDLGTVLRAPPGSFDCASSNRYFVGGVGDFSVVLDEDSTYLYFFFSQYASRESAQGVSVARLAWADRDAPSGRMAVWLRGETWLPARAIMMTEETRYLFPAGNPVFGVTDSWHDADNVVGAFWGPSVHYNSYLEQYVMLLNRAEDPNWTQEGIYVSFAPRLDDPTLWSAPQRLLASGRWYPQVVGLESGIGTDRVAGERARFFMGGRSEYIIQFSR